MGRDDEAGRYDRRSFLLLAGGTLAGGFASRSSAAASAVPVTPSVPAAVTPEAAAELQRQVRGAVVLRGTPLYETWRQSMVWNYRKFRRFPDLIVQAEDESDVVAAINFARSRGVHITSRGGGHSWSGCFLRDGGVLLDLSRMQSLEIDVRAREARVQPGVIGRILNARLGESGLAFPTAHCGMVPISGFLMGGGLGLNSVAWGGMSVFNIRAVDLVTAQGERLHASAEKNPDYFWACRGAGPGLFFTVTRFYLTCHPLPRAITSDSYFLPFEELVALTEAMNELGPKVDPRLELLAVVIPTPPGMPCKGRTGGCERVAVLSASAFADAPREATAMLAPLRRHPLLKNALMKVSDRPTPFEVLYQDNEGPFPQRRARADNIYTDRVSEAAQVLSRHMPAAPSPGNTPVILWRGAQSFPDAAYSAQGRFYFASYAQWDHAEDDLANEAWLKALYDEMQPLASGHYINEFDRETRADRTRYCFAPANWQRLQDLRRKYDPDHVFHGFLGVPA
jgi:FAD/FMN-containing dehydrogenase